MANCKPCFEEGRGQVVAHYNGTPAGMSRNGKEIPPMCYYHRNRVALPNLQPPPPVNAGVDPNAVTIPTVIKVKVAPAKATAPQVDRGNEKAMPENKCECGCGNPLSPGDIEAQRAYIWGHKTASRSRTAAAAPAKPKPNGHAAADATKIQSSEMPLSEFLLRSKRTPFDNDLDPIVADIRKMSAETVKLLTPPEGPKSLKRFHNRVGRALRTAGIKATVWQFEKRCLAIVKQNAAGAKA